MQQDPVRVYAVPWCPKCKRVRAFLDAAGVPYREHNPETEVDAGRRLAAGTGGSPAVPAVQIGERFLRDPSDAELARALGVPVPADLQVFEVAVVGGGPAGLTAAIYTAREGFETLLLEKALTGGQAAVTDQIENYPGFPEPVGGADLMERVDRQARKFGVDIRTFAEVTTIEPAGRLLRVRTADTTYQACSVIVATGSVYRRLGVPGEEELVGRGVSFCATCDAPFFRDKHVVVVGGGNSALQEALHLSGFAARITMIQLLDHLTGTRLLEERIRSIPGIEILLSHKLTRIVGTDGVEAVEVQSVPGGATRRIACDGVFVFVGLDPNTAFLRGALDLDEQGFVRADPTSLQTSLPGVFAAGDVRAGSAKQVSVAVGEGTLASFMVKKWLERRHRAARGEAPE